MNNKQPTMEEWQKSAAMFFEHRNDCVCRSCLRLSKMLKAIYERGVRNERSRNPLGHSTDCICVRCEDANRAVSAADKAAYERGVRDGRAQRNRELGFVFADKDGNPVDDMERK